MKLMSKDSSATAREQAPHATKLSRTNTIIDALKRRAQSVLNDKSIDARSRAIIRYALEVNDPWLARLVRQADAGESIVDDFSKTPDADEDDSSEEKIEALAEMICRASNESAGALLVLMATLENSTHPKALANAVKHLAFTRCGAMNLYGIVDAQIATVESVLFAGTV
jgi:hypothetical protein